MLDINIIRKNIKKIKYAMSTRNKNIDFDRLLDLDLKRRSLIKEIEQLRIKRNQCSEEVYNLKNENKNISIDFIANINNLKDKIKKQNKELSNIENEINDFLFRIPNVPDKSVPSGKNSHDNKVVEFIGKPKKFLFKPKCHIEIGEGLDIIDFNLASKISGSRFVVLKNEGCDLERAIILFFLDIHKKKGYSEISLPYLVNKASMIGTGQLPNFEKDLFKCINDDLYLIPTSEVSVSNIYRDCVLKEFLLPKKYVSYSACFRREAGSYGKDVRGLIRNHQFNKVELVKFVKPETSNDELTSLVSDVGDVLELLELPYRIVLLCTGDIGFSSSKTYDLEVWFAGDGVYREISSCSNFKDFQSRRMNIKYVKHDKKKEFIHTLNGSGLAVGRTFAAILENYQQKDGSVIIPEQLQKYTGFDIISPKK